MVMILYIVSVLSVNYAFNLSTLCEGVLLTYCSDLCGLVMLAQALMKNSTEAMKEARVFDILNSVSCSSVYILEASCVLSQLGRVEQAVMTRTLLFNCLVHSFYMNMLLFSCS